MLVLYITDFAEINSKTSLIKPKFGFLEGTLIPGNRLFNLLAEVGQFLSNFLVSQQANIFSY